MVQTKQKRYVTSFGQDVPFPVPSHCISKGADRGCTKGVNEREGGGGKKGEHKGTWGLSWDVLSLIPSHRVTSKGHTGGAREGHT